jgi:branched-chain amino acid transport system permease protein
MMTQVLLNGTAQGSIYALVALGFAIMYRTCQFTDFSFAGTIVAGAFAAAFLGQRTSVPWEGVLVSGPLVAALAGALCEMSVYRTLRRRRASELVFVLASLGLMVVLINLVSLEFGDRPQLVRPVSIMSYSIGSGRSTGVQIGTFLATVLVGITVWIALHRTRWGFRLRAVASNRWLATAIGVDSQGASLQAVILGSAIGGLGATLAGFDTGVTPTVGFGLLLPGVLAAIMAGRNVVAALPFGILVGIVQQFGAWLTSPAWQDVVLLVMLVLVLLLRPKGLEGKDDD